MVKEEHSTSEDDEDDDGDDVVVDDDRSLFSRDNNHIQRQLVWYRCHAYRGSSSKGVILLPKRS